MKQKYALSMILSLCLFSCASHAGFVLMRSGKPACQILLSENAGVVEKHAASELSLFLGKIAGTGNCPEVVESASLPALRFVLSDDTKIEDEGFMLSSSPSALLISARQPVGFIYGAYDILKRYGGIRWLTPGVDGEYFSVKPDIVADKGELVSNPSFFFRNINWGSASIRSLKWDSYDWMMRNGLRIFEMYHTLLYHELRPGLEARAAEIQNGGHCFSDLLNSNGLIEGNAKERFQTMFKEHPEYFPVINGERTFLEGQKYQPCTSNPEVVRIMTESLIGDLDKYCSQTPAGRYRLVNNDGTGWCQCDECKKIDAGDTGMTRRYWSFINELGSRVWEKRPNAIINTIAYQNYEAAPTDIIPDERFATIELSFNRICYRHRIDDPNCLQNRRYLQQYKDWAKLTKKTGHALVAYAQINALGSVNMPIEDTYIYDLQVYHQLGIRGLRPQLPPVDGRYGPRFVNMSPMSSKLCWYGMWQTLYLFTLNAWDINTDNVAALEEANRLYYGNAAWDGGMKEFRLLLSKTFRETPGCYGHGYSSPLGRCLDNPETAAKLEALLARALEAASKSGDERALAHVKREAEVYALTWLKFRDDYQANFREFISYRRQQPIVIDGRLDEFDWGNADLISNFKLCEGERNLASEQTLVKVVHEEENIYFGVVALEPTPDKMITAINKHDGPVWEDNTVEFFLTHPDLSNAYYQIIVNANGTVFDHFVRPGSKNDASFDSKIEVKTQIGKDRWTLEARIPTGPLGEKCFDGQAWKINILRSRKIAGASASSKQSSRSSTLSGGPPHSVDTFLPLNFCHQRAISKHGREIDVRAWRNGSFNEVSSKKHEAQKGEWIIHNGVMPAEWQTAGRRGEIELLTSPDNPTEHYIRFRGIILNNCYAPTKHAKITMRVRGKGTLHVSWYCYNEKPKRVFSHSVPIAKQEVDTDGWQLLTFICDQPEVDMNKLAINSVPGKESFIELDDVFIRENTP